jgi:hypothetical protein
MNLWPAKFVSILKYRPLPANHALHSDAAKSAAPVSLPVRPYVSCPRMLSVIRLRGTYNDKGKKIVGSGPMKMKLNVNSMRGGETIFGNYWKFIL